MTTPSRYPRPPALGKLGPGHNVVESSAGTGKTFLLEHMVVDLLLLRHAAIDEILVVTFTEKATAELVLRIRRLLAQLAAWKDDEPGRNSATREPAAAPAQADTWIIDEPARARLRQALLRFDDASIFTIHGFCERVLREHAFVQGRFFDEDLVAESTAVRAAFREILRKETASEGALPLAIQAWLSSGRSVAALEELLLEAHGKGSFEMEQGVDQARLVAAMQAWHRSAADCEGLRQRLKRAKLGTSTINSIIDRVCRIAAVIEENDAVGFLVAKPRLPSGETLQESLRWIATRLPAATDPELGLFAALVADMQELAIPFDAFLLASLLPMCRQRAAEHKQRMGSYDFDDMLGLVARALHDASPAGRLLLESLRRRYRHALIDEFQDTDETQWSIFRRVFVEAGGSHTLTVIGDPKQAIYGFRGADVHTYLEAVQALQKAGAAHLVLDRSFRSSAGMVAATNAFFDQKEDFFRRDSGICYDTPVACGRQDLALVTQAGDSLPPVVVFDLEARAESVSAGDAREALQGAIVDEVARLLDPSTPVRLASRDGSRRLRPRDIFVLTFTNPESQAMGRALRGAGIPFAFYKVGRLFESPEALEVLAVLRAIAAPNDPSLRAKALLTSFFGLDLAAAAAVADTGAAAAPLRLLFELASLARAGDIPGLFAAIIDAGVIRRHVFAQSGERSLTNILHLFELLQRQWAKSHAPVDELADLLDSLIRGTRELPGEEGDLQRLETDADAVQILTVHKAKGLEADVVFVYGGTGEKSVACVHVFHEGRKRMLVVGKLYGRAKDQVDLDKADERRRLLYVAMTRARYRLYLPRYPAAFKRLVGPYLAANQRLGSLVKAPDSAGTEDALFAVDPRAVTSAPAGSVRPRPSSQAALPTALLEPVLVPGDLDAIKSKRRGFEVSSYTAIRHHRGPLPPMAQVRGLDEGLPGGAETGILLHEMLAKVSLSQLAEHPSFEEWYAQPALHALLARICRRHARPEAHLPIAARLVHTAFTQTVRLGDVSVSLANVRPALREMEFLFPMPEENHPLLSSTSDAWDRPWTVERGVVKGIIDLLFEHERKTYVCDWKSDVLPAFGREVLGTYCRASYETQARIYITATLRMLSVRTAADYAERFGGMFFCFLRGLAPHDQDEGIYFFRPTWDEVLGFEDAMLDHSFWGLRP